MSYPQSTDYQEALQHPSTVFSDPVLRRGSVETSLLGLPLARSGGFAYTYRVDAAGRPFAVRCFYRDIADIEARYSAISAKLRMLNSRYFVGFDFQPLGIRVNGKAFPIVKMDWVSGDTLSQFLDKNAGNRAALERLRTWLFELSCFLDEAGLAHGDISNENLLVDGSGIKLIDYDGMYVPGMQLGRGSEVGMRHFQHPARQTSDFGPLLDRFSFIVVDVSLMALIENPALHQKYREGGQTIIFRANDFLDPGQSEIFRLLSTSPSVRDAASRLAALCGAQFSSIPSLAAFRSGKALPQPISPSPPRPVPRGYAGAFPVVNASDFLAVEARVGQMVELVGRVVSVKRGEVKRGKKKGSPFVFINFGIWNKESVKLTIWSEGLSALTNAPDKSWEGEYISVTGLIDPPYVGSHYGKPYRNVGMNVSSNSQVVRLTANEANFRLTSPQVQVLVAPRPVTDINRGILQTLGSPVKPTTGARPIATPPTPSTPSVSTNAKILEGIKGQSGVAAPIPAPSRNVAPPTAYPPPPRRDAEDDNSLPTWVWIAGGLFVLFLIFKR